MQRPEYKNIFAVSQSAIKFFKTKTLQEFRGIYITKDITVEDDDKYAFGSLVDTVAFTPSLIDERFFIPEQEITVPGEKVKEILDNVYKKALVIVENKKILNNQGNLPESIPIPDIEDLYSWQDLIIECSKENKYGGSTWTRTRILENVFADGMGYFLMLSSCRNRYLITAMDNADAVEMVDALKSNKHTYKYFTEQPNTTLLFQQEIFIDYAFEDIVIPLKAALDIILLDHERETIEIPDLKTTHTSQYFRKIAKDFDYITQVSFYKYIVTEWLKTYKEGIYAQYKFLPLINIVIDRKAKIPYIYEYSWDDADIAENGSEANYVEGWKHTLNRIGWHIKTGIWDRPKELHETGRIMLNMYNNK